jgi:hypothetical protein
MQAAELAPAVVNGGHVAKIPGRIPGGQTRPSQRAFILRVDARAPPTSTHGMVAVLGGGDLPRD